MKLEPGAWTGHGANDGGDEPHSLDCHRKFADDSRDHQQMRPIKVSCKEGLKDEPGLLFSALDESNADKIVLCVRAFQEHIKKSGVEGVFRIVLANGTTVDMFHNPGLLNVDMVNTWCQDLIKDGAHEVGTDGKPTGDRLALCVCDKLNLRWTGTGLLSSCTELFKIELELAIPVHERWGPRLTLEVFCRICSPSQSKIDSLKKKLESLDVTKCPGENITQFVKEAIDVVREINVNIVRPNQVPQLTWSALTGLLTSSDTEIRSKARMMHLENDGDEFGAAAGQKFRAADPIIAPNVFDRMHRRLKNANDCGPAKSAERHKASHPGAD